MDHEGGGVPVAFIGVADLMIITDSPLLTTIFGGSFVLVVL
jgi:hypothetical protein